MTRILFAYFFMTTMAAIAGSESKLEHVAAEESLVEKGAQSLDGFIHNGEFLVDPNFIFIKEITKKDSIKPNPAVVKVFFKQEPGESNQEFEAKNSYRFRMSKSWIIALNGMLADAKRENRKLLFNANRLDIENEKHYLFFGENVLLPLKGVLSPSLYFISLNETLVDVSAIKPVYSRRCFSPNPLVGYKIDKTFFPFASLPAPWVAEFKRITELGEGTKVKIAMRILKNAKVYKEMPAHIVFEVTKTF
jgi:hypothetical protein